MRTKKFWLDTAERVGVTFAQALIAGIGVDQVDIVTLDWPAILGIAATTALLSFLKSIAASRLGKPDSASLVE